MYSFNAFSSVAHVQYIEHYTLTKTLELQVSVAGQVKVMSLQCVNYF